MLRYVKVFLHFSRVLLILWVVFHPKFRSFTTYECLVFQKRSAASSCCQVLCGIGSRCKGNLPVSSFRFRKWGKPLLSGQQRGINQVLFDSWTEKPGNRDDLDPPPEGATLPASCLLEGSARSETARSGQVGIIPGFVDGIKFGKTTTRNKATLSSESVRRPKHHHIFISHKHGKMVRDFRMQLLQQGPAGAWSKDRTRTQHVVKGSNK